MMTFLPSRILIINMPWARFFGNASKSKLIVTLKVPQLSAYSG